MKKSILLMSLFLTLLSFSKASFGVNFAVFKTLEIHKQVNEKTNIYTGTNLGVIFNTQADKVTEKFLPKADFYVGVGYKNIEFQIGAGYPKVFSAGIGIRF